MISFEIHSIILLITFISLFVDFIVLLAKYFHQGSYDFIGHEFLKVT